jgi:uncharacterized Zn-finger protein
VTEIVNQAKENHEGRFVCVLCGRTISTKGSLKRHLETTHCIHVEPGHCHLCGKVTKNKDALRSHMRYHHQKPEQQQQPI